MYVAHVVPFKKLCSLLLCDLIQRWLYFYARLEYLTARNTLFVHLVVWDCCYDKTSFTFFLENAFLASPYLEHIIMVVPPNTTTSDIFDEHFVRIYPLSCEGEKQRTQWLFLSTRQKHVPKLNIRLAMEDDNDDLMEIFNDIEFIHDTYGEYYFAELCNQDDDKSFLIVAEVSIYKINIDRLL
ncbi:cilia- and flagella-associated protein 61-like [Schistocerca cancellata]|uniref:cilia- and flagella-associated protein 61-like n=1 Tax=Schistocerca cancellata TaxID=274614 RepID=UPI0021172D5A|nr:cilia- and flagella-associated protein 61-like [Schistocerca cancellata]